MPSPSPPNRKYLNTKYPFIKPTGPNRFSHMPNQTEPQTKPTKRQRRSNLTIGQCAADLIAKWAGSWYFISLFALYLIVWMVLNTYLLLTAPWDPYPFILLNLTLSCLAAIQAPVILMSQNRAAERDRARAEHDYYINRKAEREIKMIQLDLLEIKEALLKRPTTEYTKKLNSEIKNIQLELDQMAARMI